MKDAGTDVDVSNLDHAETIDDFTVEKQKLRKIFKRYKLDEIVKKMYSHQPSGGC